MSDDALSEYFGSDVGHALNEWARHRGSTVRLPAQPWSRSGFSGALIAAIVIDSHGRGGRTGAHKVLVKISPRAAEPESARHHDAWNFDPAFAERRLVPQIESAYPVGDGRMLTFQTITGSLRDAKGLDQLAPEHRSTAYATVVRIVLGEWNDVADGDDAGPVMMSGTVGNFLAGELGERRDDAIRWSQDNLSGLDELAAPLRLLTDAPGRLAKIDYIAGPSHGDLHGGNILIPCTPSGGPELDAVRLIDLAGFAPAAPLSRDVAALTISLARSFIVKPSDETAQDEMIALIVNPRGGAWHGLPRWVADTAIAIDAETERWIQANWVDEWRVQRHLSLIAHAMLATSFDNVPVAAKRWFLRLATQLSHDLPVDSGPAASSPLSTIQDSAAAHPSERSQIEPSGSIYHTEVRTNRGVIATGHGATAIGRIQVTNDESAGS